MTKKPDFAKIMMGVFVLALMFIGAFAITTAPRTRAAMVGAGTLHMGPVPNALPVATPSWNGIFEIEGDAVDSNGLATLPDDWNDINPGDIATTQSTSVTGSVAGAHAIVRTFISDPPISTDLIYTGGGSKDFNDINSWGQVAKGTGPPKDDIQHAYAAKYVNPTNSHSLLVFGGDRGTNNGDANLGFWFFQNPVTPNNSGGFDQLHKNGDVFVLSAFSGGGGTSTIRVLVWVGTPDTAGPGGSDSGSVARCATYGNGTGVIDPKSDSTQFPAGTLCDITGASPLAGTGITNGASVAVSWQYVNVDSPQGGKAPAGTGVNCTTPNCTIPTPDFFEGVIDLNELGLASECFASFLLETRSSAEVSAVLKDFAQGNFESCSGVCDKTVNLGEVCEGTSSTFTYSTQNTGGVDLGQTLKDDNATPNDSSDDFYITGASAGVCTTGSSPVTITVPVGQTFSCTRTVTLSVGTHTDTLTVHTVSPFVGAVADCTNSATVKVNPNPTANTASLELCETTVGGATATFDLTSKNSTVTGGASGVSVSWFSDSGLTTSISTPAAFSSGNATVYAKVTNNTTGCFNSAAVTLTVDPRPSANTASLELCETTTGGGQATFDLTSVNNTVKGGGGGTVSWFTNSSLTTAIATPASFTSGSTTVYARVTNTVTGCFNSAAVTLTVDPNPVVSINNFACNTSGSALLTATVTSGTGPFTYTWTKQGQAGTITPPDLAHPETISVTTTGTYKVDGTDAKGCVAAQASRTVGLCTSCSP
jgi:hypothetical protein